MRAAAIALAALLLAGCTEESPGDLVRASPTPSPTPVTLRLLSESDLPGGFRFRRDQTLSPQPLPPPMSPPECAQRPAVEEVPQAMRLFERERSLIVEDVTVYASAERASRELAARAPDPSACSSATVGAPGQPAVVLAVPTLVPAPQVGEQSVAYVDSEQTTVVFRSGRVVVQVTAVRTTMSVDDVVALARRALNVLIGTTQS